MSAQHSKGCDTPRPLCGRLTEGASAAQVADAVGAIWLEIDEVLHPIIGRRGMAALYNRSVKLTVSAYPWLGPGYQVALSAVDPTALKSALASQTPAEATAGGSALFLSFHELLASLVGSSLTDRLLRSVWNHSSGASSAQDTTS
jgi:hypothetical protein